MKATSIKQIKFNRGQVSDLLSERVDMGLQNACGTVYDNIYINRYGQIQQAPTPVLCCDAPMTSTERILCMFDTGVDKVYVVTASFYLNPGIKVFGPISKSNPGKVDFSSPCASYTLTTPLYGGKAMQFGYNVLVYGQKTKPILFNIVPAVGHENWDNNIVLTVKENYFDNAFDNVYVRGINTETPTGFTVPTSGSYKILNQESITTAYIVTVSRNGAGGAFTQDLVGQVIQATANGGVLQVRKVIDADNLEAYVLSPLVATSSVSTDIYISWNATTVGGPATWLFGYVHPYGNTAGPNNTSSYPDSAVYVNQRLIFGGNDYHGSLISASRIGVINDFDPESATESDAFTTSIASKDFCRIVDFTVSNGELRIACTNGEYAMSLANLTPTKSLNGFDLRSEVGIAKDTAICDCGGLTAYVSHDGDAVYGTQFSLLRDRYQPISLTSQTKGIVEDCKQLRYATNRRNNEGNCLIGLNNNKSMFVGGIDLNAGLINLSKILKFGTSQPLTDGFSTNITLISIFVTGEAVWGEVACGYSNVYQGYTYRFLVRFKFGEMFAFPTWYRYYEPGAIIPPSETHPNEMVLPQKLAVVASQNYSDLPFRALYKGTDGQYYVIKPTSYTDNNDGTYTVNFADDIAQENIVCAGFVRQSDWRSVEIGVGMATRELNKQIIKLESVIEPLQVTGEGRFAGTVLTPDQARKFIKLTRSKDVETIDIDNLSATSYTESADLVWRRAFDNPSREMHYGVSSVMPFLVKSITATVSYDEVQ